MWNNWKTYQTFVGQKKIIQNKPTAWLRNIFLLLQYRHIMFHIILHIIFPSCTSFSDFVFSENQSTCILFNYLRISILFIIIFQQTAEVLGNLTDFFLFFIFTTVFYVKVKLVDHITRSISQIIWFRGNSFPGTKGKFIFPKSASNFINPKSLK